MSSRIRKILKHTVIAVLSLAVLFLVLNLFLTGRLERYLKRELIERTAIATDRLNCFFFVLFSNSI